MVAFLGAALLVMAFAPALRFRRFDERARAVVAELRRPTSVALLLGAVAFVAIGVPAHTALIATTLGIAGSAAWRHSLERARWRRLRVALPAVADGLAAAIRAGLPLVDALPAVASGQPVEVERALHDASGLLRLGRSLDEALDPIDAVFGPSALLLRETLRSFYRRGGNVARSLERAAQLARAEAELQDEIHALTAQGRASALVLALLVPMGLAFSLVANPTGARGFLADPRGGALLSAAFALEGIGSFWLWWMVRR